MADIETVAVDANGKPIATMKIIDKETGTETPVNVATCAEAVVCNKGIPMEQHLQNLYGHAGNADVHLSAGEKAVLETQAGAQEKATKAKQEAIAASSLEISAAKAAAAADTTAKANAARDAAYKYADKVEESLSAHKDDNNNPHKVTAAQVGLGNVPNKATNDLQPTYTSASVLTPLSSGERLAVSFGKIAKAITHFIEHISNASNPHSVTPAQIGALAAVQSTEYPGCYYRTVDGEVEWITPPMLIDTEYRTTERYEGNPVYIKRISLGQCPSGSEEETIIKWVDIGINHRKGVRFEVMFLRTASDYGLMEMNRLSDGDGRVLECWWQDKSFCLRSYAAKAANYEAYLTVKYVK